MSKKKKILIAAMVIMALAITVNETLAYFSTYVRSKGTKPVSLTETVRFKEENVDGGKHVVITAAENSNPIYVRVRVYAIDEVLEQLVYSNTAGWNYNGGENWWYYEQPLYANQSAILDVNLKEDAQITVEKFNIIVIYEFIPATMGSNGQLYGDWNADWTIEKEVAVNEEP